MQRTIPRRRAGLAMLVVLAVAAGLLLWANPPAEAAKPQPLDHFRCYRVTAATPPLVGIFVVLIDQFDVDASAPPVAQVFDPDWFCNPVAKRHRNRTFGITNPDAHLKFHRIETAPTPPITFRYKNQFESGLATVGQARWLAVPTQKEGHEPPQRLDHFKCYEVLAEPADTVVGLADQWLAEPQVEVGGAVMFCNPTRKIDATGQGADIGNPRGHLMCYRTGSIAGFAFQTETLNQFGFQFLAVEEADMLCVPTRKAKKFDIAAPG